MVQETLIRWGIAGTGVISDWVVQDMRRLPDAFAPTAVFSRSRQKAEDFAARHGLPVVAETFDALVGSPDVDAVYIATPFMTHVELSLAALAAGKHVLVEKPIATRAADVELLFEEASRRGVFIMEAMWFRFNPALRRLVELVSDGTIGQVRNVRAAFGVAIPPEWAPGRWDPERSPGALFDQGIYPVTLAHVVLGEPDDIVVRGAMARPPVDTTAHYTFEYADGRFAQLASSMVEFTDTSASVAGTGGLARLPGMFWSAQALEVLAGDIQRMLGAPDVLSFPAEGRGYVPMLVAVDAAIREGIFEHPDHGRAGTAAVIRSLEAIQAALVNPAGSGDLR